MKLFLKIQSAFAVFALSMLLASCANMDPRKVDVELKESAPEAKTTNYTQALSDLGLMTEIYATDALKIQSNPIGDNTGTSGSTGGEIPRDITEIMKSSLNSIGGNVVYIPYDPSFIQNQMVTGYSGFENKTIPQVILTGGITEFDRGLVSRSSNTDASAEAEFSGLPDALPAKNVALKYGDAGKDSVSRITLDFNLLDFKTMSGIPKMNTVNTMEVSKILAGKELGISLFGQTFGLKGSVKKVQGRHAAVRLLVELSMIQIVGKHLVLPYWRLLGDDAQPDKVVMDTITKYYYGLSDAERVANVQTWLYLYGNDLKPTGKLDTATVNAIKQAAPGFQGKVDQDTFVKIYTNIPINHAALGRREMLAKLLQGDATAAEAAPAEPQQVEAAAEPQPQQRKAQKETRAEPAQKTAATQKKGGVTGKKIGRILSEEEW